jgi:hypothetical protein
MEEEVKVTETPEEDKSEGILDEDIATILLNEITQGYRDWAMGEDTYRTRFPTPKEDADARLAYATAFNDAMERGIPTIKQLERRLKEHGIWRTEDEEELKVIRDKMTQIEIILSKKDPKDKSKTTRKLAEELLEMRSQALEKSSQLNEFLNNTIEALAEEVKQAYYVSTCTERRDGSKVWNTPEEYMNSRDASLVNAAAYEYITFTNGLAENYLEMLPEVKFMKRESD